jgi:hypothetical protein
MRQTHRPNATTAEGSRLSGYGSVACPSMRNIP